MGQAFSFICALFSRSCNATELINDITFRPPCPCQYIIGDVANSTVGEYYNQGNAQTIPGNVLIEFLSVKPNISICVMHVRCMNSKCLIIYSHGNATDCGGMLPRALALSKTLSVDIVIYDYEGYGYSDGSCEEASMCRDIDCVFQYSLTYFPSTNIILYGESIGSVPTCHLAGRLGKNKRSIYNSNTDKEDIGIAKPSRPTSLIRGQGSASSQSDPNGITEALFNELCKVTASPQSEFSYDTYDDELDMDYTTTIKARNSKYAVELNEATQRRRLTSFALLSDNNEKPPSSYVKDKKKKRYLPKGGREGALHKKYSRSDIDGVINLAGVVLHSAVLSGINTINRFQACTCIDLFDNSKSVKQIECPVFNIHGVKDAIVSIKSGKALYELSRYKYDPWWVEDSGHNDIIRNHTQQYMKEIGDFITYCLNRPN